MKIIKITTDGRVTIPALLRKKYNLTHGRRVKFVVSNDGIKIIPLITQEDIKTNAGFLGTKGKMITS